MLSPFTRDELGSTGFEDFVQSTKQRLPDPEMARRSANGVNQVMKMITGHSVADAKIECEDGMEFDSDLPDHDIPCDNCHKFYSIAGLKPDAKVEGKRIVVCYNCVLNDLVKVDS